MSFAVLFVSCAPALAARCARWKGVAMSDRGTPTYHVQLRQFPHNHCRFNLSAQELEAIAQRWARDEWVEVGERKWTPHQAHLVILAGPRLADAQLTMGRGWRNAERDGEDVTDRVLEAMREGAASSAAGNASSGTAAHHSPPAAAAPDRSATASPPGTSPDRSLIADSVALELLALLDSAPATLVRAYELARARLPAAPASECLALAELAVRSLLSRGLAELARDAHAPANTPALAGQELEVILRALESWAEGAQVRLRRT
jgi:hypothetical protein